MPLTKAELGRLRDLRQKAEREASRRFVVESPKVVRELLATGFRFERIYFTGEPPCASGADEVDLPLIEVSASEMARISHLPTPSTVFAVGCILASTLSPAETNQGLTLALNGVQDPGNVGTLLRIADWFAFARVLLSEDSADLYHQKVINASMGSFARVRTVRGHLPTLLAGTSVPIVGCVLDGESVFQMGPRTDAVVVIGSEGRGLSPEVESLLTHRVTIPRLGSAESLNAAVAAGIVAAHLRRPSA